MDGKVLLDLYEENPPPVEKIPSWDAVPGDHGMHPPDRQISASDSKAALEQLVALGYIDEPGEDQSEAIERTVRELDYNLAQAYIDGGIYTEAVAILERLYGKWPMEHRFGFKLAVCYRSLQRNADLREIVRIVSERRLREAEQAREELKALAPASEEEAKAESERLEALPEKEREAEGKKRRELLGKARPNLFSLRYLEASADYSEKKYEQALEKLTELDQDYGARRNALTLRGEVLQRLRRWEDSRAAFEQALEFDRETPGPLLGLARTALAERKFDEAAEYARASIGLLYFQPPAHYLHGLALYRGGRWQEAERALRISTEQSPLAAPAWRLLGEIARLYKRDPQEEQQMRLRLRDARQRLVALRNAKKEDFLQNQSQPLRPGENPEDRPMPTLLPRPEVLEGKPPEKIVTIVSGLPRSGTSLMMQLLEAADIPLFSDGKRKADGSNEKGYHEHDKVGSLMSSPGSEMARGNPRSRH